MTTDVHDVVVDGAVSVDVHDVDVVGVDVDVAGVDG